MSTPASADNNPWFDDNDSFLNHKRITDLTTTDFNRMQGVNPDQDRWFREQNNAWNRNQASNYVSRLDEPDLKNPVYAPQEPLRPSPPPGFIGDPKARPGTPYRQIHQPATPGPWRPGFPNRVPTRERMREFFPYWDEVNPPPTPPSESTSPPPPGTPPPTPRTNGGSGGGSAGGGASTSPPSTGSPRQATSTAAPPGTRPSNPEGAVATGTPGGGYVGTGGGSNGAAVRKQIPGGAAASAVSTFANDIINGRNPVDAAGHSAAVAAGTVVGAVVCSELGPFGAMVCGSIGGNIGGALYDKFFHPQSATIPVEPVVAPLPFHGGQGDGGRCRKGNDNIARMDK